MLLQKPAESRRPVAEEWRQEGLLAQLVELVLHQLALQKWSRLEGSLFKRKSRLRNHQEVLKSFGGAGKRLAARQVRLSDSRIQSSQNTLRVAAGRKADRGSLCVIDRTSIGQI
jgi:hypothetical protein